MQKVTLAVIIPVGPVCELENIWDTIESVRHYVTPSHVVILLDDSGKGTGATVRAHSPGVVVQPSERVYGRHSGLYFTLSRGFAFAYQNYAFDVLLRLDTDALVIGHNPERDAIAYFEKNPGSGIIGSYRTDCNGKPRGFSWAREKLEQELGFRSVLRPGRVRGWFLLRRVLKQSLRNGYEPGEHCMGGAYFMSRECVGRLMTGNLLARREILWSRLHEDQLFGLFIHAVGLKHGDFATGHHPMGLRWRGLPCSPRVLITNKKKVTHSTRFFENMDEQTIRAFFRAHRQSQPATELSNPFGQASGKLPRSEAKQELPGFAGGLGES